MPVPVILNDHTKPTQTRTLHLCHDVSESDLLQTRTQDDERRKTKTTTPNRKIRTFNMLIQILYFFSSVYTFNLISVNTQGLRNVHRRQTFFNLIKQQKYIIFFQETHWTDDLNSEILREWGGTIVFNNFEPNARGTAILFHPNFDYQNHNTTCDSQGRTIQVVIEHADHKFNLIKTYAPRTNTERKYYFTTLSNFLSATEENILGGDFNFICNNKLDKLGGNPNARQSATAILHTITQQYNLTDIWRDRNRDIRKFTKILTITHIFTHVLTASISLPLSPLLSQKQTLFLSHSPTTTLSAFPSISTNSHTVRDSGTLIITCSRITFLTQL